MNKFVKQIAVAALAITTLTAGTTTQVQAGSDFGKALLGVAAAGIIIHELKKDKAHNNQSSQIQRQRSVQRKTYRPRQRVSRHGSRNNSHFSGGQRRPYGY